MIFCLNGVVAWDWVEKRESHAKSVRLGIYDMLQYKLCPHRPLHYGTAPVDLSRSQNHGSHDYLCAHKGCWCTLLPLTVDWSISVLFSEYKGQDLSFQCFHVVKLWKMLWQVKVTQNALRRHNLIVLTSFCSSIVSKTMKMFHQFLSTCKY